jgi:hypothetical protein
MVSASKEHGSLVLRYPPAELSRSQRQSACTANISTLCRSIGKIQTRHN